ncbi:hypothetical protein HID58_020461 [Brassica napus]|uniref:Tyrosine specific protein phosphatases domain-containing protein n=1 Tax=Brassica napus TaxID=3708 RepID=A0ABQ7XGR8_BRANA|nr:hypothetical protein HID58_020461 [Brassica napus]
MSNVTEKEERSAEEVSVEDGDKEIVVTTKMALVRVPCSNPTLVYNVVRNKVEAEFHWWDRVAHLYYLELSRFRLMFRAAEGAWCMDLIVLTTCDCHGDMFCTFHGSYMPSCRVLSITTYVHCKAGRGRSTTVVICYLVQHKHMTPEEAYAYVKSIRPRVKLATAHGSSLTDATSALIPRNVKQVCSGNVVVFEDGSMVVVTHADVEGYDDDSKRSMNVAGNELWVKVVGQAALARISCLCLVASRPQAFSKNLSMSGIRVDISVSLLVNMCLSSDNS